MERHEKTCVYNPNRVCEMCVYGDLTQQPMEKLINAANEDARKYNIRDGPFDELEFKNLRDVSEGCPACILAVFLQDKTDAYFEFDYKSEAKQFLKRHEPESRGYY